ncbi:MAG: radical SAM protein [bacterium]|nr:radical SAM protein [bacterium]
MPGPLPGHDHPLHAPLLGPGERVQVVRLSAGQEWLGLDVPSSTLFWLSDSAWGLLAEAGGVSGSAPPPLGTESPTLRDEARDELVRLLQQGDITRLSPTPEPHPPDAATQPVTSLSLGISTRCNLRCRYCFGRQHDGPDGVLYHQPREHMPRHVALAAVDFLFRHAGDAPVVTVNFFGGEPLLNPEVVRDTGTAALERARAENRQVEFAMTTNGTLLDQARLDMLGDLGIRPLISLDGPREVHDAARPFANGRGSYRSAADGARRALARDPSLMARATMNGQCTSYVEIAESLLRLGFRRLHITAASPVNPAFGLGREGFDALHAPFTAFCDWYLHGVEEGRFRDFFFGPLDHLIGDLYRRRVGVYPCTAGLTGLYVTPAGDLYPCFRAVRPEYRLGSVLDDGFDGSLRRPFFAAAADRRPACADCWARYICRGECMGDNLDENGDIGTPTPARCRLTHHYVAEAARCLAHLSRHVPSVLPERFPSTPPPGCRA